MLQRLRSRAGTSSAASILLKLAMAIGVVAGLLAMHSVTAEMPNASASSPGASVGAHSGSAFTHAVQPASAEVVGPGVSADSRSPHPAGTDHCAIGCAAPGDSGGHGMLTMFCVLALLTAVLVIFLPSLIVRLLRRPNVAGFRALQRAVGVLADRPPPSLVLLSISRT